MSHEWHEWDWPPSPRRVRHYVELELQVTAPPKAPARRDPWVVASKIAIEFIKVIIAIPLTAIVIAAVFFLYILLTLP
jgi:hypothetical protein